MCCEALLETSIKTKDKMLGFPICKHKFHKTCIYRWFEIGKETCPNCRSQLKRSMLEHYHPNDYLEFLGGAY